MGSRIKIYVPSPLGFSEIGRVFYYQELIPRIEQVGYQVIDPWTLTTIEKKQRIEWMTDLSKKRHSWKKLNVEIGGNNKEGIDDSDGLVAVLDGTDVDSGTAAEIGYAFAKGKPILGYRGEFRLRADNEGAIVNLQVEYFIQTSGGAIITEIDKLQEELKRIFG